MVSNVSECFLCDVYLCSQSIVGISCEEVAFVLYLQCLLILLKAMKIVELFSFKQIKVIVSFNLKSLACSQHSKSSLILKLDFSTGLL